MREKISQAAKGVFGYESSNLQISVAELQIEINAGERIQGSISITNELSRYMRGSVNTDCHFLEFPENMFQGVTNEVSYIFHAETLQPGETVRGNICIISDCGTKKIPVTVTIGVPFCEVSTGKIKDLFHFTNLAKENPDEAASLFRNPHFEEIFLYRDNANIALYRGLSRGTSKEMAMEEFLIAIHKKLPIRLRVDKSDFRYKDCEKSFTDHFVMTKDNWGFEEYHIKSDSSFVVPEHKIVWTDDFMGNTYSVPFLVDTDKMVPGENYARITISTVRQKIEITIAANKAGDSHEAMVLHLQRQRQIYRLMHLYLEFCMGHISNEEYLSEAGEVVLEMEKSGMTLVNQLFRVHLGMMEHRDTVVKSGLAFLETQKEKLKTKGGLLYCAYLYLRGLWADDDEVAAACVRKIEGYYQKDQRNWKLLWFLLYLSPEFQSEKRKLEEIVKMLNDSCRSPMLYIEICSILNESPDLLLDLSHGICQALHWGCRQEYLGKELAMRYCYLAGRLKLFSKVVLNDLCRLYEQYREEEILAAVCKMLMKGQVTDKKAFYWYNLGIEHNLKLTDFYEYYMYSIDGHQEITLQDSTLLYFLYDNHLTVTKKAMLYAYIIQKKDTLDETYDSYRAIMEEFTLSQLEAGRMSNDLAVLYEEFVKEECINERIARQLPEVMFCHEIFCENPDIIGVYVTHRELEGEEFVPFVNGRAVVHIFTEHYRIFLADQLDNRYVQSVPYTSNKMLHLDHLAKSCMEKNAEDYRLLLYLQDRAERMNQRGKEMMDVRRRALTIPNISRYHYKKTFCMLVRYYYDNFEGDYLDEALANLDWAVVNPSDRKQFVEYCIVRRFFGKAMEGIEQYGYEKLEGKQLLKVASRSFAENMDQENTSLVKLAWFIFGTGHFDENLMKYLCKYYLGSIHEMVRIWRYAKGFSIEMEGFAERILGQIIFTEEMCPDAYEVFYEYYESGRDKLLILAFMKFFAYKYLVHNWMLSQKMFSYFYKEVQLQENPLCLIAVLKFLSQGGKLTEEEKQFADYNISKLYEKKMIFPFYRDFYGKISLPIHILDEYYVEYTANPEYEVRIHYLVSSGYEKDEYVTETMRDIFYGIRVKEFVLFQDEVLQYYISEVRPEGEVITKSATVSFDETMDNERTSSRYHMLNLMMIAREMKEEGTLIDLMKEYAQMQENVNLLFKPLE